MEASENSFQLKDFLPSNVRKVGVGILGNEDTYDKFKVDFIIDHVYIMSGLCSSFKIYIH